MVRLNQEQLYCKFDWKERETILKTGRRIKPHGIYIFADLAEETMAKRRKLLPKLKRAKDKGKIAYFFLRQTSHLRQTTSASSPTGRSYYLYE